MIDIDYNLTNVIIIIIINLIYIAQFDANDILTALYIVNGWLQIVLNTHYSRLPLSCRMCSVSNNNRQTREASRVKFIYIAPANC